MDPFTLMVGFNKKFGVVLILQTEIKLKSELKRKFEFLSIWTMGEVGGT